MTTLTGTLVLLESSHHLLLRKHTKILHHCESNCHELLHNPLAQLYQECQFVLLHHPKRPDKNQTKIIHIKLNEI